jgi:thiol-disulfide isomerase/thioredoxin
MRWACVAGLLIVLLSASWAGAAEGEGDMPRRAKLGEFVPSQQPAPAPAVSLTDVSGNTVELSDFKGRLVVVNLWATWCEPCLREMPSLERLQSKLGDRIAVLGVSQDRGGNKTVEPFIAKLGLKSVKIFIDPKSVVGRAFEVRGLPTSLLIDRDGKLLGRVEGAAEWDSPKIMAVLDRFLSGDGVVKASSR